VNKCRVQLVMLRIFRGQRGIPEIHEVENYLREFQCFPRSPLLPQIWQLFRPNDCSIIRHLSPLIIHQIFIMQFINIINGEHSLNLN